MSALYTLFGGSRGLVALLTSALGTDAELLVASSTASAPRVSCDVKLLPGSILRGEKTSDSENGLRRRVSTFRCAIAASDLASEPRATTDLLRFCGETYRIENVSETRLADGAIVYRLECEKS